MRLLLETTIVGGSDEQPPRKWIRSSGECVIISCTAIVCLPEGLSNSRAVHRRLLQASQVSQVADVRIARAKGVHPSATVLVVIVVGTTRLAILTEPLQVTSDMITILLLNQRTGFGGVANGASLDAFCRVLVSIGHCSHQQRQKNTNSGDCTCNGALHLCGDLQPSSKQWGSRSYRCCTDLEPSHRCTIAGVLVAGSKLIKQAGDCIFTLLGYTSCKACGTIPAVAAKRGAVCTTVNVNPKNESKMNCGVGPGVCFGS